MRSTRHDRDRFGWRRGAPSAARAPGAGMIPAGVTDFSPRERIEAAAAALAAAFQDEPLDGAEHHEALRLILGWWIEPISLTARHEFGACWIEAVVDEDDLFVGLEDEIAAALRRMDEDTDVEGALEPARRERRRRVQEAVDLASAPGSTVRLHVCVPRGSQKPGWIVPGGRYEDS